MESLKKIRKFLDSIESYECPEIAFYQWYLSVLEATNGVREIPYNWAEIDDEEKQAMECMKND